MARECQFPNLFQCHVTVVLPLVIATVDGAVTAT